MTSHLQLDRIRYRGGCWAGTETGKRYADLLGMVDGAAELNPPRVYEIHRELHALYHRTPWGDSTGDDLHALLAMVFVKHGEELRAWLKEATKP